MRFLFYILFSLNCFGFKTKSNILYNRKTLKTIATTKIALHLTLEWYTWNDFRKLFFFFHKCTVSYWVLVVIEYSGDQLTAWGWLIQELTKPSLINKSKALYLPHYTGVKTRCPHIAQHLHTFGHSYLLR